MAESYKDLVRFRLARVCLSSRLHGRGKPRPTLDLSVRLMETTPVAIFRSKHSDIFDICKKSRTQRDQFILKNS